MHRQGEQHHIGTDLDDSVRYPPWPFIQTLTIDSFLVPEICHRLTLNDGANDVHDSSDDDKGIYGVAGSSKVQRRDGEDAVVKADDGDFVEHEYDFVHYLRAVEPLSGCDACFGTEVVPFASIAIHNS